MEIPSDLASRIREWARSRGLVPARALMRIGEGVFGVSVACASGIPLAQLRHLPEDVVLSFKDAAGEGGGSDEEAECSRLEGLALKNALDPAGQERLVALMDRREAARLALQAERRERAMYGGRTLAEMQEGGNDAA